MYSFSPKLLRRWADKIESIGKDGGQPRAFDHPFVQACFMFFGEFMCLFVFKFLFFNLRKRNVS